MYLQAIKLANFKNYEEASLEFSSKVNCFVGNNGAGKTNILDAIHYLSFCKSYFNQSDLQNILHEAPYFALHGDYLRNTGSDRVSCVLKRGHKKQFRINKKDYDRLADHIGLFPLVMISPYDRDLINEGSELRRRYIDSVISQFDKVYLDDLITYNKALYQRNTLLKQFAERHVFDAESLEIWDVQLARIGHGLHAKRAGFLNAFVPVFQRYFEFISGGLEQVHIEYQSQLSNGQMEDLLKVALPKDRAVKYTTVGIHKDDLRFTINGYPVKRFGSQGQQKSFVVAIKLAQFDYTRDIKGCRPILLLDDIFDKLDDQRVEQLVKLVSQDNFGQVFITDTQRNRLEKMMNQIAIEHRLFDVQNGNVQLINQ